MKTKIFFILLAVLALGFVITLPAATMPEKAAPAEAAYVLLEGAKVAVEVADTPAEQAKGLSGRDALPEGEGLLFVFERPGKHAFWMKDMNFPIDIIWIGADMRVAHLEKNVPPDSYPQRFVPELPAQYVLEVPAGFADELDVTIGAPVVFTR